MRKSVAERHAVLSVSAGSQIINYSIRQMTIVQETTGCTSNYSLSKVQRFPLQLWPPTSKKCGVSIAFSLMLPLGYLATRFCHYLTPFNLYLELARRMASHRFLFAVLSLRLDRAASFCTSFSWRYPTGKLQRFARPAYRFAVCCKRKKGTFVAELSEIRH